MIEKKGKIPIKVWLHELCSFTHSSHPARASYTLVIFVCKKVFVEAVARSLELQTLSRIIKFFLWHSTIYLDYVGSSVAQRLYLIVHFPSVKRNADIFFLLRTVLLLIRAAVQRSFRWLSNKYLHTNARTRISHIFCLTSEVL